MGPYLSQLSGKDIDSFEKIKGNIVFKIWPHLFNNRIFHYLINICLETSTQGHRRFLGLIVTDIFIVRGLSSR